jgi:hypothetical protein
MDHHVVITQLMMEIKDLREKLAAQQEQINQLKQHGS